MIKMRGLVKTIVALLLAAVSIKAAAPRIPRALQELAALPPSEAANKVRTWMLSQTRDSVDEVIVRALEKLRELMLSGVPEHGVPVLDPFHIPHHDLRINTEQVKLLGSLDDVIIRNLSSYKIERITNDLNNLRIDFVLSFDQISLTGLYNITGIAVDSIDIFGSGPFSLLVKGLTSDGTVSMTSITGNKDSPAKIDKVDIRLSIRKLKAKFQNLMGGGAMGDLVNEIISESGPDFFEVNHKELSNLIGKQLEQAVNPVLGQHTLGHILDVLN